ncbi:MBL fold metallo-hydrolase [Oceanobacillus halophilus]|uniref:MBL fold metallo-hydrolase n=1 Tax=Oceanobacillus halophilus TaxID=930130 RepID=A0A495ACY1_9BACI|nr:MBL fold metallo-hydrolase [Oceanobacillus halophilus]RKQ37788.1 MBL fold metallo-hydrolase [Oceanobacillus halophilus]
MNVECLPVGPLGTNCYIVSKEKNALIIDPGGEPDKIIGYLNRIKATPSAILLTHAHFDHIGAVEDLRNEFGIEVYLHTLEHSWLENPQLNGSVAFIGNEISAKPPEHELKAGKLNLRTFSFEVVHTPGHSPGSVSFIFHEGNFIIGGDVLFKQGIGRTDLPGGDLSQLEKSIQNHFYTLPDNFTVYPGHGPRTTIQDEKINNPFVR